MVGGIILTINYRTGARFTLFWFYDDEHLFYDIHFYYFYYYYYYATIFLSISFGLIACGVDYF